MIAAALAAVCSDPEILAHLGGPLGDAVRARAAELRALAPAARQPTRAAWAATVRAPRPAGFRGIDATWIEAALAGLPARARADLASGGGDPTGVWLARWATAELVPMPPTDHVVPPRSADEVLRMPADLLVTWLADVGADQLAFALGEAGRGVAALRITLPPRAGSLGTRRAAIARCKLDLGDDGLLRIGARAVAPRIDALARRQLVLRLPRTRGLAVLFELCAHAQDAVDAAPTWAALAAR